MLRASALPRIQVLPWRPFVSNLTTSSSLSSSRLNPPLDLDPSTKELLRNDDISLMSEKHVPHSRRELEEIASEPSPDDHLKEYTYEEEEYSSRDSRRSPAALFGGRRIGAVILPHELEASIDRVIAECGKSQLRSDFVRLFRDSQNDKGSAWVPHYGVKYRSRQQRERHESRDGTAFASVVLPAHYSVIFSVIDHLKHRLGPDWKVKRVIDWGAGTGSALWATAYSFQDTPDSTQDISMDEPHLNRTALYEYIGIEKRDGLTAMSKRLLQDVDNGRLSTSWWRAFREVGATEVKAEETLAISAFNLSSLPDSVARTSVIKQMWASNADVIVLIDHNTAQGFECIAEARDRLLRLGKKVLNDPAMGTGWIPGSHVVAPCPHDAECPLFYPGASKLPCGFMQRLQRPPFVRLTKHSSVGHENITYSYVAVRRGPRPIPTITKVGRVAKALLDEELASRTQTGVRVLKLHADHVEGQPELESSHMQGTTDAIGNEPDIQDILRREAYGWPRLVVPPLKRSGHIIIDGCTPEGKIMRMTIPRSQGKQYYYDARKARWGDIFPHEPKNPPQERHNPNVKNEKLEGSDIGKRRRLERSSNESKWRTSYDVLIKAHTLSRRQQKQERRKGLTDFEHDDQ